MIYLQWDLVSLEVLERTEEVYATQDLPKGQPLGCRIHLGVFDVILLDSTASEHLEK